ncbi:hypothetical protein PNA2_1090 [Pyrococcus sp. NA2]|nr:hypothetical protein PNA2_1090 [Pyrococcus sp. NA2]
MEEFSCYLALQVVHYLDVNVVWHYFEGNDLTPDFFRIFLEHFFKPLGDLL